MTRSVRLPEIARIIRSKNAGPFEVTLDVMFADRADFERVRTSGSITPEVIAERYNLATQQILTFAWFAPANALKITLPRPRAQGSIGETDMHAAQQHAPLLSIMVTLED